MDPFTAIGLAGNIITFLDFGYKLISTAKSIRTSASGASAYNDDLSYQTKQIQQLADNLKVSKSTSSLSKQELSLLQVASDCKRVSVELAKLLDKLKARNPGSKREALRATIRDWRTKDQKDDLELKLDRCRQQLNLELVSLSRSESLERLNQLIAHGQASGDELQSLAKNVESLRLGCNVSCLSSEALGQVRSLLQLTDDAVLKVRQARVLDGLRFELMNERFEDIKTAHEATFDWIFSGDEVCIDNKTKSQNNANYGHNSEYNGVDSEYHSEDDTDEDSEVSPINSSRAPSLASNTPRSTDNSENAIYGDLSTFPDSVNQLDDDSSFEWFVDDSPSLHSNAPSEYISDHGDSTNLINNRLPSRSLLPAPLGAEEENLTKARDGFITWLEQDDGIFHISGKPGSGKSTLMKYLTRHPKTREHLSVWADGKKFVLGSFFFWKPGSVLQKSIKGLVRGMLHCVLEECPDLIPLAFPAQWEASMHREKVHIEHHQCQQAFENIVAASRTDGKHKIALFIDGLDEFEGNHADLIRQLLSWSNEGQNIKLCVSSREWAIFQDAFKNCPKFRLHDLTRSDIRRYVRDRFSEMHINTLLETYDDDDWDDSVDKVTWLREKIVVESVGVFLWVAIVLRHIEEGLVNGDRFRDLTRLIDSLPTDLEPMFQQLLGSIPRNNRRLAYSMLSLARFCIKYYYEVSVMHYSFLEEYVENKDFAMNSAVKLFTAKENSDRLERAQRRIYGICKGLLELSPQSHPFVSPFSSVLGCPVRLIHRSITEFLDSQYFNQGMDLECPGFDPFDAYCQTCLRQLQRVHLPPSYFAPPSRLSHSYPSRGSCSLMAYLTTSSGLVSPVLRLWFRQNIESRIFHIVMRGQVATLRFCKFLDAADRALGDLNICVPVKRGLGVNDWYSMVNGPRELITLGCAQLGFYEYFVFKQDPNPEQLARCASTCLLGFEFLYDESTNAWTRAYKTLETLFDHGASPDSSIIPGKEPAFHKMLNFWCHYNRPSLATTAFMLYHGVNPRFAIVSSKTKYRCEVSDSRDFRLVQMPVFKAYCQAELPASEPGREGKTIQISDGPGTSYIIRTTPEVLDVVSRYGHTINLRTLVSLWFPGQSAILQEVIDWIVELGVPVDACHRSQLQAQFGSRLRPLFDPDHPEFIGFRIDAQQLFPGHAVTMEEELRGAMVVIRREERSLMKRYVEIQGETVEKQG
ncbi:hypothetical protein F5Y13DRAFT_150473 [Hypoxylon sp. FL1857]|nr:hypothetical protein F5Y13DRAFT_150473 [Hypoxylon sp. FL1857]